ncbi:MAG: hypothetical protein U9Q12_01735 [Patescibacteria group bacterium]|nr:hypothetical protein [Patescibacteria group bacterium]
MNKIFLVFILLSVPQIVYGANVTQEILNRLGFYETSQSSLLRSSDGNTWKCGTIDDEVIQYRVSGDILGYNPNAKQWIRLITPMSSAVPVTAFALFMDENGMIARSVAVMKQCTALQMQSIDKMTEPQNKETPPPEYIGKPMLSETVDTLSEQVPEVVRVETTEQNNLDATEISSTWELMAIYQEQTGGR